MLNQVVHSYIHEKLIDTQADLAAELSGHFYFYDRYYGFDNEEHPIDAHIRPIRPIIL